MRIHLVRHGQPAWSVDGNSIDDPDLTGSGHEQAIRLVPRVVPGDTGCETELAGDCDGRPGRVDRFLVSPLRRAAQTAVPVAGALGEMPIQRAWLAEISNPRWEGAPVEHVEQVFAEQRLRPVDELWEGLEGGESFRDFHDRVTTGLVEELASLGLRTCNDHPRLWELDDADIEVLAVAHAGTNAVVVGALLGIAPVPWEWERFVTHHASVTELVTVPIGGAHAFTLRRLSDVSHLPPGLHTR